MNYLINILILFFVNINILFAANSSDERILFKIKNNAYTSIDLEIRKNYLKLLNNEISYDEKEFVSQKLVDHLKIKFNKDLNSDSTFINYMSYVSKIKKNRNKLSVTLNYNKRIQEKKNDSLKNNLLDTSVKITEIFPTIVPAIPNEKLKQKKYING